MQYYITGYYTVISVSAQYRNICHTFSPDVTDVRNIPGPLPLFRTESDRKLGRPGNEARYSDSCYRAYDECLCMCSVKGR